MKQHVPLYWLPSVMSTGWEKKTCISSYLHITNNEFVINKCIPSGVSLCFGFIKFHKLGGKGVTKGYSHDDVQD